MRVLVTERERKVPFVFPFVHSGGPGRGTGEKGRLESRGISKHIPFIVNFPVSPFPLGEGSLAVFVHLLLLHSFRLSPLFISYFLTFSFLLLTFTFHPLCSRFFLAFFPLLTFFQPFIFWSRVLVFSYYR